MRRHHVFAQQDSQQRRKRHRYWSVVENRGAAGERVVQRHVLHLGEINHSQELTWRRLIEVLDAAADRPKTLSLFPEDRCDRLLPAASIVPLKLSRLRLCRPRQWGAVGRRCRCGRTCSSIGSGLRAIQRVARARAGIRNYSCWSPSACWRPAASGGCWFTAMRRGCFPAGSWTGRPTTRRRFGSSRPTIIPTTTRSPRFGGGS